MPKSLLFALLLVVPLEAAAVDYVAEEPIAAPEQADPEVSTDTAPGSEPTTSTTGTGTADAPITAPSDSSKVLAPPAPNEAPAPISIPRFSVPRGGGGQAAAPAPEVPRFNCRMPNRKATAEQVLARPGMAEALTRLCRNKTDWTYLDKLVDELRRTDRRWGYFCRRGHCDDPSHDVLAYYCGPGEPWSGTDNAVGVDFVVASCYDPGDGANPSIGWGVFEEGNPVGTSAWTSRGRF